jgi:hypothetical protein
MEIPERNKFFGYIVGGSWTSDNYKDSIRKYEFTEGGLDYNAGLVGALGYIVSKLDPADTSNFVGVLSGNHYAEPRRAPFSIIYRTGGYLSFCSIGSNRIASLSIYDQLGRKIHEQRTPASTMQWKPAITRGVLIVRARLEDGGGITRPFCFTR